LINWLIACLRRRQNGFQYKQRVLAACMAATPLWCQHLSCVFPCRVVVPDLPAHGSRFRETPLTLDNAIGTLHDVIQKEAGGQKVGG
jgi:hypothetical protein